MSEYGHPRSAEAQCEELRKQAEYYRSISETSGRKRLQEITQLHRLVQQLRSSEEALRENEERFRLVAQTTNDIFYVWNLENDELEWLGAIDSALGYEPGEIDQTLEAWLQLIHPEDRPALADAAALHRVSEEPIRYTYRVICRDGSVRHWDDHGSPLLNSEGRPVKWLGGISDITGQVRTEQALIEAQRMNPIGELSSGIAHDFNNSLQSMLGTIELALLEPLSPEVGGYLQTIRESAVDAASRIRQLQRFAGHRAGRQERERIDLNTLVDSVILQTKPLWKDECERRGCVIDVEKSFSRNNLPVDANTGDLRSALYNIIKNSIQAMPKGGKLSLSTGRVQSVVFLAISDTGVGMDYETQAKIFEPFVTTKGYELGRGLGMSTSYAVVKEHDGELLVRHSAPGQGTTIEIRLPEAMRDLRATEEVAPSSRIRSARVLWVDDEKLVRDVGRRMMTELNQQVDTAANGQEAITLLRRRAYDLMITDIGMPVMNGIQLLRKIRGKYPSMDVAILTGWDSGSFQDAEKDLGVRFLLNKPVDLKQLIRILRQVPKVQPKGMHGT